MPHLKKQTHVHIDSINVDSLALVHQNIPKEKQKVGKRLPFFYFWIKDHFYQRSPENFKHTTWSFSDDPKPIARNKDLKQKLTENKPDVIGLGIYSWNIDVMLKNAKWYRKNNPNAIIVAGGPSAEATKEFLQKNPVIDLVILGPGVEIFRRVIDSQIEGNPVTRLDGVSYLKNNNVIKNKSLPRQHDPLLINFVENFRDEIKDVIESYQKNYNSVIFQTYFLHGCPYSCSFCEQGTALWTKINRRPLEHLYKEIDFLNEFKNVQYEFLDQNFGIVREYIDLMKYFIKKNVDHNIKLGYFTMAKNNIDTVFELLELIHSSGTPQFMPRHVYIALQDTNPEVLKLNGRPMSNEFEKIEKFKEVTKYEKYNLNQVDIILGLPGQSYESLAVTLYDLFHHNLLSQVPPNLYRVQPNTTLTAEDNKIYYKKQKVWHRGINSEDGMKYIEFDRVDYSLGESWVEYLVESDTINSTEIISAYYMWILVTHVSGLTRWIDTPFNYLKNYHGKTDKDLIKTITKFFNPLNRHLLPDCVKQDLNYLCRWFTGKDKFLMRRDNNNLGYLVQPTMAKYRFHFNNVEMSDLFHRIFIDMIGNDDALLHDIMKWQRFLTFSPEKKNTSMISYNYDDIAEKKFDVYYLSKYKLDFDTLDHDQIIEKFKNLEHIHFIPEITWENVDPKLQKPLDLKHYDDSRIQSIHTSQVNIHKGYIHD